MAKAQGTVHLSCETEKTENPTLLLQAWRTESTWDTADLGNGNKIDGNWP